jgi:Possible lysine decarboxylase
VLLLIQTKKVHHCPVILYDSRYWAGLINWVRDTMLTSEKISAADVGLLLLSDDPQEICELVSAAYQENSRSRDQPDRTGGARSRSTYKEAAVVTDGGLSQLTYVAICLRFTVFDVRGEKPPVTEEDGITYELKEHASKVKRRSDS